MTSNAMTSVVMRDRKLSAETRDLIDAAVAAGAVTRVQPAGLTGNEVSRGTKELIARQRRAFRKEQREAAKAK